VDFDHYDDGYDDENAALRARVEQLEAHLGHADAFAEQVVYGASAEAMPDPGSFDPEFAAQLAARAAEETYAAIAQRQQAQNVDEAGVMEAVGQAVEAVSPGFLERHAERLGDPATAALLNEPLRQALTSGDTGPLTDALLGLDRWAGSGSSARFDADQLKRQAQTLQGAGVRPPRQDGDAAEWAKIMEVGRSGQYWRSME
jgi:hypothetical protein